MNEIKPGQRVRVVGCPNRGGQLGVAGDLIGQQRSVGFASIYREGSDYLQALDMGHFAASATYEAHQLEAA